MRNTPIPRVGYLFGDYSLSGEERLLSGSSLFQWALGIKNFNSPLSWLLGWGGLLAFRREKQGSGHQKCPYNYRESVPGFTGNPKAVWAEMVITMAFPTIL